MAKLITLFVLFLAATATAADPQLPSRHFLLTQSTTIDALGPGQLVRIWVPIPQSDDWQDVREQQNQIPSTDTETHNEPVYGNKMTTFSAKADAGRSIQFSISWDITRRQAGIAVAQQGQQPLADLTASLRGDNLVPIDGKPMKLLTGITLSSDPMTLGHQLFDVVKQNMEYRKDKPGWGRGDADWACESHFGNCTDFHSLFMSLARSEKLPSVFEMGYAIPMDENGPVVGYHCWSWFYAQDKGWVPVDISESKQTGVDQFAWLDCNRVKFTAGRDLNLIPKQLGPPLNFFNGPYAESDGKPLEKSHLHVKMTYQNLK